MNAAILLCAGSSTRAGQNKTWAEVYGHPLWTLAHDTFVNHEQIDRVILVVPKGEEFRFLPFIDDKKTTITAGGATRMESFKKGLDSLGEFTANDVILDHNSANPFVTVSEISAVIAASKEYGASAVSQNCVDTVLLGEDGFYSKILEREKLRLMQTPQAVRGDILQNALSSLSADATDLTSAILEHTKVQILPAHPQNKKITFAEDLAALQAKTYLGEDSHAFSTTGTLMLGGLSVPDLPKLEANSDGDVILHAIGRALALAQNQNFSELADPLSLSGDQDSRDYLHPLLEKVRIQELVLSLECARPQIDPLALALKNSLAEILKIPTLAIRISAHTGEGLTAFGRGEGIRCLALLTVVPLN